MAVVIPNPHPPFKAAPDFWRSKATWNGIFAVMNTVVVNVLGKPEWMVYVGMFHGFLQTIFMRDGQRKNAFAIGSILSDGLQQAVATAASAQAQGIQAQIIANQLRSVAPGLSGEDARAIITELTRQLGQSVPVGQSGLQGGGWQGGLGGVIIPSNEEWQGSEIPVEPWGIAGDGGGVVTPPPARDEMLIP